MILGNYLLSISVDLTLIWVGWLISCFTSNSTDMIKGDNSKFKVPSKELEKPDIESMTLGSQAGQ